MRIKLFYDSFGQSLAFIDADDKLWFWDSFTYSFELSMRNYKNNVPTAKGDSRFEFLGYL